MKKIPIDANGNSSHAATYNEKTQKYDVIPLKGKRATYEVIAYKSESDFDNRIQAMNEQGITRKRDAITFGKVFLKTYPIVKVQSDNREFIEILKRR